MIINMQKTNKRRMINPFASRCTILGFFIYYSPRKSFRFDLEIFFTVQQLIIIYDFKLMIRCIKKMKCLSIRIKQKLMEIMYTIPTKMVIFAEVCYLSTLIFPF